MPETQTLIAQPIAANLYWLFQLPLYALFALAGTGGVSAVFIFTWLAIAGLWLYISQLYRHGLGPILFLAFIILCQLRFEQRPEVFSYLLSLLFILELTRPAPRWSLIFGMQLIWTGLHSYFVLGVLLTLAWTVSHPLQWRRSLRLLSASMLGTLCTPFGVGVWQSVAAYARLGQGLRDLNAELMSPLSLSASFPVVIFWSFALAIVSLILYQIRRRQMPFAILIALGGLLLSLQAVRNVPLLVLFSAPLWLTLPMVRGRRIIAGFTAAAAFAMIVLTWQGWYFQHTGYLGSLGFHQEWASYPIGVSEFLRTHNFNGAIFCDSYDGGYLEYHFPKSKVAGDSYFADTDLTRQYFSAIRDPAQLVLLDQKFHFDAFVINVENLQEVFWALQSPSLVLVYNDSHRALFMRKNNSWAPADLASSQYWHGESLRAPAYAFGLKAWTAVALRLRRLDLVFKIVDDVQTAREIPAPFVRSLLLVSKETQNALLLSKARAFMDRAFFLNAEEKRDLTTALAAANTCCQ